MKVILNIYLFFYYYKWNVTKCKLKLHLFNTFYLDGSQYKISCDAINPSSTFFNFDVNGTEVSVDVSQLAGKDNIENNIENNAANNIENNESESTENLRTSFSWNDAATKLFLEIYKTKKDLVTTRKIKTYKLLWKDIAENMKSHGYFVSSLQVENKFKSMERAYKNMISNNNKTGRARKTCSFETWVNKFNLCRMISV